MIWLAANWRLVAYGAAFLAVFGSGWHVRGIIAEHSLESALSDQKASLIAQCDADKKITSEVSNDYQSKIQTLNNRIASLKRLRPAGCVPISSPTSGHNEAAGNLDAGTHGITAESLIEYGGDAEKYRLQLIGCQDFVNRVWSR